MSATPLHQLTDYLSATNAFTSERRLPSLHLLQKHKTRGFEALVYNPVICLILQGAKEINIGAHTVSVTQGDALLVSHDLPVISKITDASPDKPYRALILSLDLATIRRLYEQVGDAITDDAHATSLSTCTADPAWLEPLTRYTRLLDTPLDARVLGPLVLKEIHFRLLMSPIGGMLRNLLTVDSHASRISKSILHIRARFRAPLIVADLAKHAGMSPSSFHEHFKSVTGTTPLQYQKDLRMIEARSLLARGNRSVSGTGFDVGYESPTHFSRDYARKFGCSPKHHLAQAL